MANAAYDPHKKYPDDETYSVTGKVMNSISDRIVELEAEVESYETAIVQDELKDLRLRDKNPTVKDAWDKYQLVLGLAVK